jgi:hypothetical protein
MAMTAVFLLAAPASQLHTPTNGTVNMRKTSTQIALGGVFSALCLVFMFLTGIIPLATYMMPALAGAMLAVVVIEAGAKTALLAYVAISVLSLFIVPDREAATMFIVFYGYYPLAKVRLEQLRSRALEYAVKLILCNAAAVAGYAAVIYIFGIPMMQPGTFGQYSVLVLLGLWNATFLFYDYALTRYITVYIRWFRPKFLRR